MKKEFYNSWIFFIIFYALFSSSSITNEKDFEDQSYTTSSFNLTTTFPSSEKRNDTNFVLGFSLSQNGPVTATVDPSFATICAFEELQLSASGGDNYLWVPNPGNPSGGALSDYNISNPIFSNGFFRVILCL